MSKTPRLYIEHIVEAIESIEAYVEGLDFEGFLEDRRTRQAVERNIEIISEASRRLPEEAREAEFSVPWAEVAGVGNVLRHDYDDVMPAIVWTIVSRDLHPLKAAMVRLRARYPLPE